MPERKFFFFKDLLFPVVLYFYYVIILKGIRPNLLVIARTSKLFNMVMGCGKKLKGGGGRNDIYS